METVKEVLGLVVENWQVIVLIASIGYGIGTALGKGRYKRALRGAVKLSQIMAAAIEEGDDEKPTKTAKKQVEAAVALMSDTVPKLTEAKEAVMSTVDPKDEIPAVKRFWRRALAGKNFAGVAAKVIGRAAVEAAAVEMRRRAK